MLCRSVPRAWPLAPISQGAGGGQWWDCWTQRGPRDADLLCACLSSTAQRGTGANHASASSKGFLGAANHLPSAAGKGPRGVCEASLCAEAGSSLSSGSGHASLPAWRSLADLPWVPGLPREDDRAVLGCWEQGGTGFATGQLETLGCEAGVNTWMLPGCLSSRLLGPQWLGHS